MNCQTAKKLEKNESESKSRDRKSMDINDSRDSSEIESREDEDEVTKRKNEAMEQVFQIPLIVEQIIQEVQNLNDLKQCRLVNSTWMETTTKLMLRTNSALVPLSLDSGTMKYKKFNHWHIHNYDDCYTPLDIKEDKKDVEDAADLTTLKEIMDKSTQFPSSTFIICRGVLSKPYMEHFFKVFGDSIKELKMFGVGGKSRELSLLSGLYCPNLESLYIDTDKIDLSHDISFELPKLQMLHTDDSYLGGMSCFKILETLIAPNLQVIQEFCFSRDFEAVANAGKIHCVKDLSFGVGNPDDLPKLEMIVQAGPQLETLNFSLCISFNNLDFDEKCKWMRLVQKLLDVSKTTLKSFSFDGSEYFFENINFPQFPQLREIQINPLRVVEQNDGRNPYEILSGDICPNLEVIKEFDLSRDTEQVLRAEKIHCVKKLHFYLPRLELEHLRLFLSARSQLEILEICWSGDLDKVDLDWIRELTGLLEQLLELSKDTLRSFTFLGVGTYFEDMTFPKFSKLQYLKVIVGGFAGIFPGGINLTKTFPTLEILDLEECVYFDENWNKFFPHVLIGNLSTVRTLICCDWFTDATKRNLRILCPNAQLVLKVHPEF